MIDEKDLTSEEILNLPETELQEWIRKKRIELGIEPETSSEKGLESPSGDCSDQRER
jgi:hypothetical protein